jgi:hypothetical protein
LERPFVEHGRGRQEGKTPGSRPRRMGPRGLSRTRTEGAECRGAELR